MPARSKRSLRRNAISITMNTAATATSINATGAAVSVPSKLGLLYRTHNTRLGPEDGVMLDRPVVYILSGRILEDCDYGNRLMIDTGWSPGEGQAGYRILAGCDKGGDNFHDSCFMLSWAA